MKRWITGFAIVLMLLAVGAPAIAQESDTAKDDEIVQQKKEQTKEQGNRLGLGFAYGEQKAMQVWTDTGRLILKTDDGEFAWWVDARVMLDAAVFAEDKNQLHNGVELRRGRFALKALLWSDWAAELDIDVAEAELDVKDAYVGYAGWDNALVKIGQHREPFSLEETTTSRYISFMERAYVIDALAPGRHIGVSYAKWGEHYRFMGGIYGQEIGDDDDPEEYEGDSDAIGITGRFVWVPILNKEEARTLHLGISATTRTTDAGTDKVRFRSRAETHIAHNRFVNTGKMKDVDDYQMLGLDAVVQLGSWSFQGEYITAHLNRFNDREDVDVDGWYTYVSWFPTGENRNYTMAQSRFVSPNAKNAIELLARFSTIDLNDLDAGVEGGQADNITFGLNWYFNNNVRWMINYTMVDNDQYADGDGDYIGDDDFSFLGTRLQILF